MIIGSLDVLNKRQSTSPSVSRNIQNFDASIDVNLSDDRDITFIFRKAIGRERSHSRSANIYLRCQMDSTSNAVGTGTPNFVYLGLVAVNALDKFNTFGTPATRVRIPTDGPHFSAPNHVFGEATSVGIFRTRSKLDYSYKIGF